MDVMEWTSGRFLTECLETLDGTHTEDDDITKCGYYKTLQFSPDLCLVQCYSVKSLILLRSLTKLL